MSLEEAIAYYKNEMAKWGEASNTYTAFNKILICLENARNVQEAVQFLEAESDNARSAFRRKMYREAIAHLPQ